MSPFRRYFVTMFGTLLALGIAIGLLQGYGLGGVAGAFLGLWALPRAFEWFPTASRPVVGSATGLAVWAIVVLVLGGIVSVASAVGPTSTPLMPLALLGFSLVIGAFGALLGLIEARAW